MTQKQTTSNSSNGSNGKRKHAPPPNLAAPSADPIGDAAPTRKQGELAGFARRRNEAVDDQALKLLRLEQKFSAAQEAYTKAKGHLQLLMQEHKIAVVVARDGEEGAEYTLDPGEPKLKRRKLDESKEG